MTDRPTYEQAREIAEVVAGAFNSGEVQTVEVVYTQFLSVGSQRVVTRRFMPLDAEALSGQEGSGPVYEFEPGPGQILERLLPRYVEARLFAALLEASASQHAAQQRAMKAATDNAEDLIVSLSRVMNRARQDAITTEIMEIVGGAEALRRSKARQAGVEPDLLIDEVQIQDLFRVR